MSSSSLFVAPARRVLGVIVASALLATSMAASANYYGNKERGYWWYQDPPPPREPEPAEEIPEVDVVIEGVEGEAEEEEPELFSLKWLRENFDTIKDEAIENPDDKTKVAAYLYSVRMIMDKAQNFADSAHDMVMTDPLLDNTSRVPLTGEARRALGRMTAKERREALNAMTDVAGLWFFFDTRCNFCKYQYNILKTFSRYNPDMKIRYISMDGKYFKGMENVYRNQGQAESMKISITPSVVMLAPPNKVMVLSLGMSTANQLEEKILVAARTEKLLPPEMFELQRSNRRGGLSDEEIKEIGRDKKIDTKNPAEWIDFLRGKLMEKY